jgi:hypothetical protein
MATPLTSTTFLSEYNDDFRDSDHYHRILFNNGRALQARELTQMQTIIQAELEKLARFIVNEGSIFNNAGSLASGPGAFSYTYIKVTELPTGYAQLKGTEINDGDLYARVKEVIPAADGDDATLFVKMSAGKTAGSTENTDTTKTKKFQPGATLTTSLGNITIVSANDAVGNASLAEVPEFNTLAGGHLVLVEAQTLVLSKYSADFTGVIGFKVTEDIVTASDNIALYDNSGTTPNLTSPGADRLRIVLTLTKKADIAASDTFYEVYRVRAGRVSLIKTPDKILSKIGSIIDARTYSQTGDFIEQRNTGEFDLTILKDSDDDFLQFQVSGGTAFVNGSRIERDYNLPIRVAKPRNVTNDTVTLTNEKAGANIGNYFVATTIKGLVGYIEDFTQINLYPNTSRGGTVFGTARVRGVDYVNGDYRIHVFDVNITDATKGFGDVRSIGVDAQNYADLKAIQNRYDLYNRAENSVLFKLQSDRTQEISNVNATLGIVYTTNKTGSTVTINTGNTDTFTETDDWIYQLDADGVLYTGLSVTLASNNTQAIISGVPNGNGHVIAYQTRTLVRKNKTLKPSVSTWESEQVTLSGRSFTLSKADIFRFNKVTDDDTNKDITYKFIFDNGQRDNYYGPGKGRLKNGATAPTGTVTVEYRYFEHDTPSGTGYFGGAASYADVNFSDIPRYTDGQGETHHLSSVIDMRSLQNPATETFSGGIARIEALPKNQSTLTAGTVKYWLPRMDMLNLSPDGILKYHAGASSRSLKLPKGTDPRDMNLYKVEMNPYVFNENDLFVERTDNRGFKMADLRQMESRLSNVERITTLNLLEADLNAMQVYDPNDATFIRQTEGITADNFETTIQSAWYDEDYRAALAADAGILRPLFFEKAVGFTYDSDLSNDTCVIKGNNVWPKYTEVVSDFGQTSATGVVSVNQFEIPQSIGTASLTPEADYWTNKRLVDKSYVSQSNASLVPEGTTEISSQGTETVELGQWTTK